AGDQYSLGCILYYCLAGQFPFPDQNPVKKMLAHQFEEPAPITDLAPDCPPHLAAIVARLLRKHPHDRYSSLHEACADLQVVTSDSRNGLSHRPTPPPTPAVVAPSALIPPPADRDGVETDTGPHEAEAEGPAQRNRILPWHVLAGVAAGVSAGVIMYLMMR